MSSNPNISVSFQSSKFQAETKKMTDNLKTVQKEFRLSDAALKLTGTNTDQYSNKIQSLNKQIELQSGIVSKTKEAIVQANKAKEAAALRADKARIAFEKYTEAEETSTKQTEKLKKEVELSSKAYEKAESNATKWNQKMIDSETASKNLEYALKQTNDELEQMKLEQITKSFNDFGDASVNIGGSLTRNITTPLLAASAAIYKVSTDMNASLANISTLGINNEDLLKIKPAIQEIAVAVGKNTTDISDGAYQVISAFGYTNDTLKITEINAKAAAAGLATTEESINLTSLVTKGYGDTSAEANQKVADLAFTAVRLGQTTFPDLASSVGSVVASSSALKISQEELFNVFATLSGVTGNTSEVATQYGSVLTSLMSPSESMQSALNELGFSSGFAAVEALGFKGTLDALVDSVGGSEEKLVQLAGRKEAVTAMLALTGSQSEVFTQKMNEMTNATGAADEAFAKQSEGVNEAGFIMQQSIARLQVSAQNFGDTMAPSIEKVALKIKDLTEWFQNLNDEQRETILKIGGLVAVLGPTVLIVGKLSLAIGAAIKSYAAIKTAVLAYKAANEAASTSQAILNGVMATNPALAVASALAVVIAGVAAYTISTSGAVDSTQELINETNKLTEAYESNLEAIDKQTNSQLGEIELANRLTNELEDLSEKVDKTTDDKIRMAEIVDQLNDKIPDLSLAINMETGELNKQIGVINNTVEAYKELLFVKASEKQASASAEILLDYTVQKENLENEKAALEDEYNILYEKSKNEDMFDLPSSGISATAVLANAKKEKIKLIEDEINKINVQIEEANKVIENSFEMSNDYTDKYGATTSGNTYDEISTGDINDPELQKQIQALNRELKMDSISKEEYDKNIRIIRNKYDSMNEDALVDVTNEDTSGIDSTYTPYISSYNSLESSENSKIQKEFEDLKYSLDMRYISEELYYKNIESLRDKYYSIGSTEWQKYTLELAAYDEQLYTDRRDHSDKWIADQKYYGLLSGQEEIEAYERIRKYTDEYYADGIISYKDYLDQIKDLDKDIYDTRKDLIEEAINKEVYLQTEALDARKEALAKEEDAINDSYSKRIKGIEDYYDSIELAETREERASELSELLKEEEKYQNAATKDGKAKLSKIRDEIKAINKEAEQEARDLEKQAEIDKATADRDALEEDRLRRLNILNGEYVDLDTTQKNLLENISEYAATSAGAIEKVTEKIKLMVEAISNINDISTSNSLSGNNSVTINDYGDKIITSKDEAVDYVNELYGAAENTARMWGVNI